MSNNYLTTLEIAAILHCTKSHVADLVKRGHFPGAIKMDPTRPNSSLRIPRIDVENFQKKQHVVDLLSQEPTKYFPAG